MTCTAVIVQARMSSTRLPGKVMLELAGRSVLSHVLERCQAIPGTDVVCCATVTGRDGDPIAAEAESCGAAVFRGKEMDVLDRYYRAAQSLKASTILRVTSDCPVIDPQICGRVLDLLHREEADYACNNMPPSWPHGLDCEAFSFAWLERAAREAKRPSGTRARHSVHPQPPAVPKSKPARAGRIRVKAPLDARYRGGCPFSEGALRTLAARPQWLGLSCAAVDRRARTGSCGGQRRPGSFRGPKEIFGARTRPRGTVAKMTTRTAIFRADASPGLGGGHVMRCLTPCRSTCWKGLDLRLCSRRFYARNCASPEAQQSRCQGCGRSGRAGARALGAVLARRCRLADRRPLWTRQGLRIVVPTVGPPDHGYRRSRKPGTRL